MEERNNKVLIDVEKLESLFPGKRILDDKDLREFYRFLKRLWEQSKGLPEDFREKIFALEEYFHDYILYYPGPYRPTMSQAIETLNTLLPKHD